MRYLSRMGNTGNVNWIVYRISDVMLMKAEALALRNGNDGEDDKEARALVKAVYNRSQMGYVASNNSIVGEVSRADYFETLFDKTTTLNLVLDERQRELAFEGKRWYDLVRVALRDNSTSSQIFTRFINNKYEGSSTEQYASKMATIDHLFFPIAKRELDTHSGLVQNEAYKTEDKVEKN